MVVSAIIPTLNRVDDLVKAVASVAAQTRIPDELVIIDQSDNEYSKEKIQHLVSGNPLEGRLCYIHDPSVRGLVQAKKRAVEESSGDILMFLEDDVVLESDYIEQLEKGFVENPDMMGACGVVSDVPQPGLAYRLFFHLFHRGIFYDPRVGIHGKERFRGQGLVPSHYLSGGLSAYRREVFEHIPFDTRNGFFALEDIDFSTRAARRYGYDHFFINTHAVLDHRMSPVNRAKLLPKYERKFREYISFYKKNRKSFFDLFRLIWLMIGLSIESMMAAIAYRNMDPIVGSWQGVVRGIAQQMEEA